MVRTFWQMCLCIITLGASGTLTPVRIIRTRGVRGGRQTDHIWRSDRTSQQANGHICEGRAEEGRQSDHTWRSNRTSQHVFGHRWKSIAAGFGERRGKGITLPATTPGKFMKQIGLIQRSSRTSRQVIGHGIERRAINFRRQTDLNQRSGRTSRQVNGHGREGRAKVDITLPAETPGTFINETWAHRICGQIWFVYYGVLT